MIVADTSTWIAFLTGDSGPDVDLLDRALMHRQLVMAPVVLVELFSDPQLSSQVATLLSDVPLLAIDNDYWSRAGILRARVLAKNRKARLGDALIAQSCIDHGLTLLTRDHDFRIFAAAAGLQLARP